MKKNAVKMNQLCEVTDMPRVSVVFDRRKKAVRGVVTGSIDVLVYVPRERTRRYVSTGVAVFPEQWSDEYWVVGRRDAEQLNTMIREQVEKCKGVVKESVAGTRSLSNKAMKVQRGEATFLDWMDRGIHAGRYAPATVVKHEVMFRDLSAWGKIRRFEDVTADNLREYMRHVEGLKVDGRPVCQATVHGYWRRLRKWVNDAIDERLVSQDCKLGVKVDRGVHKEREFLTDGEIDMLLKAKMPNMHLAKARDIFVVQMGCGLAYQDLMGYDFSKRTKMGELWTIGGRRQKTKVGYFTILLPFAVEVLDRWGDVVPRLSNQKYNDYLGSVMEIAGIEKHVTSHIARHTFACYCLRHGVRIEALSRALGHTDIRTTQIYARLVDNDVVEAFSKMV